MELRGERVVLRVLEREHCRWLWLESEPGDPLPPQTGVPGLSVEGADRWFDEIQLKQGTEQFYLGIFSIEGDLLGDIQVSNIDWRNRAASIGFGISRRAERRKGYASEALRVIIGFAFSELDLFRLSAIAAEYNAASVRVLEKCGFQLEGRARSALYLGSKRHDLLSFGLLRPDAGS